MSRSKSEQKRVVNVSKRGQATIPKEFREELGIEAPGRVKFVRTETGDVRVEPIQSLADLRGVLAGQTDDDGKTATELLHADRKRDKQKDREMMDRLNIDPNAIDESTDTNTDTANGE